MLRCQLHWLLVRKRVVFKIATLVHRSLSGNAPGYVADVNRSPTTASFNSVLPTLQHSFISDMQQFWRQDFCRGRTTHLEQSAPISDYVGCHTASSGGYWRHFYSNSEATAQCEQFLTAPNRNILTYLRTYVRFGAAVSVTTTDLLSCSISYVFYTVYGTIWTNKWWW